MYTVFQSLGNIYSRMVQSSFVYVFLFVILIYVDSSFYMVLTFQSVLVNFASTQPQVLYFYTFKSFKKIEFKVLNTHVKSISRTQKLRGNCTPKFLHLEFLYGTPNSFLDLMHMFISSQKRSCLSKKLYVEIELTYSEDVIFLKSHVELENFSQKV